MNLADKTGPHLTSDARQAIRTEIDALERSGHWTIRGAVIMPDHLHLLANLGPSLTLSRCIARLKSKTKEALATSGTRWQDNYYEHRLRRHESASNVLQYIFLNPFRAGLLQSKEKYPWFWLGNEERAWFEPRLDDGQPWAEWLR